MLTLKKLLVATPQPVMARALLQCRTTITRSILEIDEFGNKRKNVAGLVRATDGDRFAVVMFYEPDKKNLAESMIWAHCSCPYFCLHEDSIVSTKRGLIPIKNVVVGDTVRTHRGKKPVTAVYHVGKKKTKKIKTHMGYQLEGSETHPVLTINGDLTLEWKRLSELSIGDCIALNTAKQPMGLETPRIDPIPIDPESTRHRPPKYPVEMTPELARLLGYYVAEGHITDRKVQFCNVDPEVRKDYEECFEECFGQEPKQVDRAHYTAYAWHTDYFARWGLTEALSAQKSVPDSIMRAPRHLVVEFLRAYFEGDGSAGQQISCHSISKKLIDQIHVLLNSFGIVARKTAKDYDSYKEPFTGVIRQLEEKKTMYKLVISGQYVDRFAKEIGFVSNRKQEAVWTQPRGGHFGLPNIIPYVRQRIKLNSPRHSVYTCTDGVDRTLRIMPCHQKKSFTQTYLAQYIEASGSSLELVDPELLAALKNIQAVNAHWDPVVEIQEGEAELVDITVEDDHSFVANGVFAHNTFNVEVVNSLKKSSDVINSNGDLPVIRNPRMIPHLCKHLVALSKLAVKTKAKDLTPKQKPTTTKKPPPAEQLERPGQKRTKQYTKKPVNRVTKPQPKPQPGPVGRQPMQKPGQKPPPKPGQPAR